MALRRFSLNKLMLNSKHFQVIFFYGECRNIMFETFHLQIVGTYFIPISHSSQLSCNFGMLIIMCSQSSPIHSHLAAHVIRASSSVAVGPLIMHLWYFPEISHSDHLLILTNTRKWDLEQTRWRPVMVRVKDALVASGTRLLMLRPPSLHLPRRCGIHCPSE